MPITVRYKKQTADESLDIEYRPEMLLPKPGDRVVSPFNNTRFVTVVNVTRDAPRNCYEIQIDE